ncbi:hypothetical protein V8C26DRAFT_414241 [Trichoderma gracile]
MRRKSPIMSSTLTSHSLLLVVISSHAEKLLRAVLHTSCSILQEMSETQDHPCKLSSKVHCRSGITVQTPDHIHFLPSDAKSSMTSTPRNTSALLLGQTSPGSTGHTFRC